MLPSGGRDILFEETGPQYRSIVSKRPAERQEFHRSARGGPSAEIPRLEAAVHGHRRPGIFRQRTKRLSSGDGRRLAGSRDVDCQRGRLAVTEVVADREVELLCRVLTEQ